MKKKSFMALVFACLLICCSLALIGCKKPEGTTPAPDSDPEPTAESVAIGFGETRTLTVDGTVTEWTTSNDKIVIVSDGGEIMGVGIGEATVSAKVGSDKTDFVVTVSKSSNVPVCELDLTQRNMIKNATVTLAPKIKIKGHTLAVTCTYQSSNTSVATVSAQGVITAVAIGSAEITVSYSAGGYDNSVKVPVKVIDDIDFAVSAQSFTLTAHPLKSGGKYEKTGSVTVTELKLNGADVTDYTGLTFVSDDTDVVTVEKNDNVCTITAQGFGSTVVKAKYNSGSTEVEIDIDVEVVKETITVTEKAKIDPTRDAYEQTPSDKAYIELPYEVQIADSEVQTVATASGTVLSTSAGLSVPKTAISDKEVALNITTDKYVYSVKAKVDNSVVTIGTKEFNEQFDNSQSVINHKGTRTMLSSFDGRTDVIRFTVPASAPGDIWETHGGILRLNKYLNKGYAYTDITDGVLMFEVKASKGTLIGGYEYFDNLKEGISGGGYGLSADTKKFNKKYIKVINSEFEETAFADEQWNTVIIDYKNLPCTLADGRVWSPSIANPTISSDCTVYYDNITYMSQEAYARLSGNPVDAKYTVTFEGEGTDAIQEQQVAYRGTIAAVTEPVVDGKTFIGWAVGEQLVDITKLYITKDVTLMAVFETNA